MIILLLGKDGQLGQELQRSLAPLGQLTAFGRELADLSQTSQLYAKVIATRPDLIVNAAAYTAVDKAQSEPALAHAINADAPKVLAQAALDLGCQLIHYSTDYVFNGSGDTAWTEASPTEPLSVYGRTKLAGERAIQDSHCQHFIFRTSWVYAKTGSNFAKTMLRLACERESLSVINDQIGAPTDAAWLAEITALAILGQPTGHDQAPSGIYHAACAGTVSWHGYASYLIAKACELGFPIKISPQAIKTVPSEAFPSAAVRPRNSRLDCAKLVRTFGASPPPWQRGIDQLLQHLKP